MYYGLFGTLNIYLNIYLHLQNILLALIKGKGKNHEKFDTVQFNYVIVCIFIHI